MCWRNDVKKKYIFLIGILVILICFLIAKCIFINVNSDVEQKEEKTEVEIVREFYDDLNSKFFEYMIEIYDDEKYISGELEQTTYVVTLRDLDNMGKDISMFLEPKLTKSCDLDDTYGEAKFVGKDEKGLNEFEYMVTLGCKIMKEDAAK